MAWLRLTGSLAARDSRSPSECPTGRECHRAVVVGSNVWLFGGNNESARFDEMWRLDLETLRWCLVEPATRERPTARSAHTMVGYGSKLVVFGGWSGKGELSDVWTFDTREYGWACGAWVRSPWLGGWRRPALAALGRPGLAAMGRPGLAALGRPGLAALGRPGLAALERRALTALGRPALIPLVAALSLL
jgi:Kelch motif.